MRGIHVSCRLPLTAGLTRDPRKIRVENKSFFDWVMRVSIDDKRSLTRRKRVGSPRPINFLFHEAADRSIE